MPTGGKEVVVVEEVQVEVVGGRQEGVEAGEGREGEGGGGGDGGGWRERGKDLVVEVVVDGRRFTGMVEGRMWRCRGGGREGEEGC